MTNSVDPDQMASSEAIWSGSTLFAKVGVVVKSRIRVKADFEISLWVQIVQFHEISYCELIHWCSLNGNNFMHPQEKFKTILPTITSKMGAALNPL